MLEVDILVGFCDRCEERWLFHKKLHKALCPTCGYGFSTKVGSQLTTHRTFNLTKKKYQIKNKEKFTQWLEDQD